MGARLTAAQRADKMVSGQPWHPFDFHNNPLCYDPKPQVGTDYTNRLFEQTKIAYIAANEASANLQFAFIPCSMSNGWLAYQLAEDYAATVRAATKASTGKAFLTTQNLKNYVAPSELMNRVILPNRQANQAMLDQAEKRFPSFGMIGPVDFEGPIRSTRTDHHLNQGASFQDWTFESWWLPRVSDCDRIILSGDHAYSRYANVEELLGDLVQCGIYHDLRRGRQLDVVDMQGRSIPLSDRAWERAKHVVNVVERGFQTDLAVMVLIAQFQLHDWLQDNGSPLNRAHIHPDLLQRSKADISRMEKLKSIMLPYLANKCLEWTPWQDDPHVRSYVERNILPYVGAEINVENAQKTLFRYQPKGGFDYPPEVVAKALGQEPAIAAAFDDGTVKSPVLQPRRAAIATSKRRGTEGDYFASHWGAEIFEDNAYAKLSTWEKAALPFLLGSMEAHRLPEAAPRSAFYACDPKGGKLAKAWMDEHDISWIREAKTKDFAQQVINPTRYRDDAYVDSLVCDPHCEAQDIANIVSTHNILNIDAAVEKRRIFVAASGPDRLSSSARLAMQMKWFDRNADMLVVRPHWEISPDDTQMVVRALLVATGVVPRPAQSAYQMQIVLDQQSQYPRLQKMDVGDVILTLAPQVQNWLGQDNPPPARETYVATARILQLLDMYIDPGRMNVVRSKNEATGGVDTHTIISWDKVDSDLTWFMQSDPKKRDAVLQVAKDLRAQLLQKGVLFMEQADLQDLHEDYFAAWIAAHGRADLAEKRDFAGGRTFIEHRKIA